MTSTRPRDGTVEFALYRFAKLANATSPHPRDWLRFYEFIAFAHQRRVKWDADDVQAKLKSYGFEKHAETFASAYWHGRCALHMRKPRTQFESYSDWMRTDGTKLT